MSRLLGWIRGDSVPGGTAKRKRALVRLAAISMAAAFVAGTVLGALAGAGGWGLAAVAVSIPLALAGATLAARAVVARARAVNSEHRAFWLLDKLEPLRLDVREAAPGRINIIHPAIDLKHFFGGFIAVFNLARRLAERGHSVRLVALEGPALPRRLARAALALRGNRQLDRLASRWPSPPIAIRPLGAAARRPLIATHWTAAHVAAAALRAASCRALPLPDPGVRAVHLPDGQRRARSRVRATSCRTRHSSRPTCCGTGSRHTASVSSRPAPRPATAASASFRQRDHPGRPGQPASSCDGRSRGGCSSTRGPRSTRPATSSRSGRWRWTAALAEGRFAGWDLVGVGTVDGGDAARSCPARGVRCGCCREPRRRTTPSCFAPPTPALP